ncbi:hypothetical protein EJ357_16420 [Streptomyces cyaneochromogenes]|uniref:Uncharacterized protein n=1 Tax=Streptomyces cyaneochromogenes TaxID=2496836 RepID=A0A3Q9ESX8_9ACTN|nr:hypothetical protein EJ357_16420 [Streptomyces cyaneochromogenes]
MPRVDAGHCGRTPPGTSPSRRTRPRRRGGTPITAVSASRRGRLPVRGGTRPPLDAGPGNSARPAFEDEALSGPKRGSGGGSPQGRDG